jgi:hypothetical protein
MIDWKILNYINKQKNKKILLVLEDTKNISKFIRNNTCLISKEEFINHYPTNAYNIIATWDILSIGQSIDIYTYLAKMNHLLRDDGELYLKVLHTKNHLTLLENFPFSWDSIRVKSIGASKGLKLKGLIEKIINKHESYLRFKYIPDY